MFWMFILGIALPCLFVPAVAWISVLGVSLLFAGLAFGFEHIFDVHTIEGGCKLIALLTALVFVGGLVIRNKEEKSKPLAAVDLSFLMWTASIGAFWLGGGLVYSILSESPPLERCLVFGSLAAPFTLSLFFQPAKFLFKSDGLSLLTGGIRFNYLWWLLWMPFMYNDMEPAKAGDLVGKYIMIGMIALFAIYIVIEGVFATHQPETNDRSRRRLVFTAMIADFSIGWYIMIHAVRALHAAKGTETDISWMLFGLGALASYMWIRGFFLAGHFLLGLIDEDTKIFALKERFAEENQEAHGGFWPTSFSGIAIFFTVFTLAGALIANEIFDLTSRAALINISLLVEPLYIAGLRWLWPAESETGSADDHSQAA